MKVLINKLNNEIVAIVSNYSESLVTKTSEFEIETYDKELVDAFYSGCKITYDAISNKLYIENKPLTTDEKVVQLESALLETTMLLANEQVGRMQNEQAILELSMLIGGVN